MHHLGFVCVVCMCVCVCGGRATHWLYSSLKMSLSAVSDRAVVVISGRADVSRLFESQPDSQRPSAPAVTTPAVLSRDKGYCTKQSGSDGCTMFLCSVTSVEDSGRNRKSLPTSSMELRIKGKSNKGARKEEVKSILLQQKFTNKYYSKWMVLMCKSEMEPSKRHLLMDVI